MVDGRVVGALMELVLTISRDYLPTVVENTLKAEGMAPKTAEDIADLYRRLL